MTYLTDGTHLYEVLRTVRNYGLTGGSFLTLLDCVSGERRDVSPLEAALCREVR